MKQIIAYAAIALAVTTPLAQAQETAPNTDAEEGFNLMEEGAKLLLRGLLSEMDPAIKEFRDLAQDLGPTMQLFAQEMGPALAELMNSVDDLRYYQPPEMLSNGDIIIRRRDDAPLFVPDIQGEVEL